jgi:hypothetical protein
VETIEQASRGAGRLRLFSRLFFGRPIVPGRQISRNRSPPAVAARTERSNLSLGEIEDLVKHDATLCFRILRAGIRPRLPRDNISSMREACCCWRDMVRDGVAMGRRLARRDR